MFQAGSSFLTVLCFPLVLSLLLVPEAAERKMSFPQNAYLLFPDLAHELLG